jgi:hypothetical protein
MELLALLKTNRARHGARLLFWHATDDLDAIYCFDQADPRRVILG